MLTIEERHVYSTRSSSWMTGADMVSYGYGRWRVYGFALVYTHACAHTHTLCCNQSLLSDPRNTTLPTNLFVSPTVLQYKSAAWQLEWPWPIRSELAWRASTLMRAASKYWKSVNRGIQKKHQKPPPKKSENIQWSKTMLWNTGSLSVLRKEKLQVDIIFGRKKNTFMITSSFFSRYYSRNHTRIKFWRIEVVHFQDVWVLKALNVKCFCYK